MPNWKSYEKAQYFSKFKVPRIGSYWLSGNSSSTDVDAKKKMMEHKVNLGWPNFFNPEKAILRKKEGIEKSKKASEGDKASLLGARKNSSELLEENRLANLAKDAEEDHEWDDPLDFKIKVTSETALCLNHLLFFFDMLQIFSSVFFPR